MTQTRLAGIGAFVIGGALLFAIGLFLIGERRMLFEQKFTAQTEFARVSGLQVGAPVKVSGMPAGSVDAIVVPSRPAEKFRVRFTVREDLHALVRTDSIATIQTEGLVGGTFLQVSAGSDAAPRLAAGGIIQGREPFDMADLLHQMSDTIRMVNDTISSLRSDIESAVASVADTASQANALLAEVSDDVAAISESGRRVMADSQAIVEGLQQGRGTVGRLLKDDELYTRVTGMARQAEETVGEARQAVQQAREAIEEFRGKGGPAQGMAADLRETLQHARATLAHMEENTRALKRSFFFRGYFKDRGYYDLDTLSPVEYRKGVLEGDRRRALRIWLRAGVLFASRPDGTEQLTPDGRVRLESAMAHFLQYGPDAPLIVEAYAAAGSRELRYLQAQSRGALVRDYLVSRFDIPWNRTAVMPLGDRATDSPDGQTWDGIALALFVDREALRAGEAAGTGATAVRERSQPVPGDPPTTPRRDVPRPE
jgi:phospholipid/cholesterol/gamma-HCH transport system substrate-binding protein